MKYDASYYLENLYPMQDGVMRLVNDSETPFFLTGGTALSRFYLNHRFSDDLDFFVNADAAFTRHVEGIFDLLSASSQWSLLDRKTVRTESFVRFIVEKNGNELQIDFVNDIPFRVGKPLTNIGPCAIDNWENILSNKISAVTRFAAKDMVDLVYLARKYTFAWPEVLDQAARKTSGIEPRIVCEILKGMPEKELEKIHWIDPIQSRLVMQDLSRIAADLLYGRDNSLAERQ